MAWWDSRVEPLDQFAGSSEVHDENTGKKNGLTVQEIEDVQHRVNRVLYELLPDKAPPRATDAHSGSRAARDTVGRQPEAGGPTCGREHTVRRTQSPEAWFRLRVGHRFDGRASRWIGGS